MAKVPTCKNDAHALIISSLIAEMGHIEAKGSMKKPVVFISHITEEKEIALALKSLIESHFLGMIDVFVSTDPISLRLGQRWLDTITDALKKCEVEIILASPDSIKRPWINFEAGSGWVKNIPVIPLCHSGMTPIGLPDPLGSLMSASIDDVGLKRVFLELSAAIKSTPPNVDFKDFIASVRAFESVSKDIAAIQEASPVKPTAGLLAHELQTLVAVGESDSPASTNALKNTLGNEGVTPIAVQLALKMLQRKGFVTLKMESDYNHNEYEGAQVTDDGWDWLNENKSLLKLRYKMPDNPPDDEAEFPQDEVPF